MNSVNTLTALQELGVEVEFKEWFNSDNIIKEGANYLTQCTQYRIKMCMQQIQEYFINEYVERQY
ncbi:hypothetical protein Phi19:3_gp052 [Cellulophaga phage phi19:3]|uniref:Uncharacterized protein n=1 Tax=Cellulophaga phage phi19:3 TaxID=1327971 RepID=R9ZWH0_9CAUD|nr:hypothetical protein Phi19:3_gp052 [Cellulophaga phage phi19:3]AGO47456.1 hypothetical protein Phi19:3_gp052 [Cellulophaga phage phi19:3]